LAARTARSLKRLGKLPVDFEVLPAEVVETTAGAVLALFAEDVIPSGMTMRKTLEQIHRAGGLAYLIHPGTPGAPQRLRELDFDGYMIQPGVFETYRLGPLLTDPALADKPGIAGSGSLYSATSGLPYTVVSAAGGSVEAIRSALTRRQFYAAPAVYLPFMTAASFAPVARFAGFLDNWYRLHSFAQQHLARWIGADCVTLTTSWDDELRDMMDLAGLPRGIHDLWDGTSPLRDWPRLGCITAEYSWWRVGYDSETETAFVGAVARW
jgi:hypothetical protein